MKGKKIGDRTYKVHLDGYNLMPCSRVVAWPRQEFIYWTDDGNVAALRYNNWKVTFLKQNAQGLDVWQEPFQELRAPLLANLRSDPFERGEYEGMDYGHWYVDHVSCWRQRQGTWASGSRASANSRRARSRAASISTA